MIEKVNSYVPEIFMEASAQAAVSKGYRAGGDALASFILKSLNGSSVTMGDVISKVVMQTGLGQRQAKDTLDALISSGAIIKCGAAAGRGIFIKAAGTAVAHKNNANQ
jgi:hypothetical protein